MDQQELLKRIDQAAQEGWITLDLRSQRITELPPEIGQLTQLQSLYLSSNHLTVLPPEIGQLTQLQSLDLAHNQLTALPLLHRRRCRRSDCSPKQTCVVVFCLCKCHH